MKSLIDSNVYGHLKYKERERITLLRAELYTGQALASEVFELLHRREFKIEGAYNVCYNSEEAAIQGDFLFQR